MFRAVGLARSVKQFGQKAQLRPLSVTNSSNSLIKNFKEAFKAEAEKEGVDDAIKKLEKQVSDDVKKAAQSEKYKKIKKETASGFESLTDKAGDLGKSIEDSKYGEQIKKSLDSVEKKLGGIYESVKNMEFTDRQSPEERMAVFTDDYVSPNYNPNVILRKRKEIDAEFRQMHYEADADSYGIAVHRDSILYEKFKSSAMGKRMDDVSDKIAASENTMLRGMVFLKSKASGSWTKLTSNKYNETIKAVRKIDKTFDQEHFVKFLEKEMIPIVLEAKAINDTEVIEDWCFDSPAQKFSIRHRERAKDKIRYFEKTINLQKIEILDAIVHDGMPTFSIQFETNTLMAYCDKDGNLIEQQGYPLPTEVYKTYNQWTICRDPMEPEPAAAWRVLECEEFSNKLAF